MSRATWDADLREELAGYDPTRDHDPVACDGDGWLHHPRHHLDDEPHGRCVECPGCRRCEG